MTEIATIPQQVTHRVCPGCGLIKSQNELEMTNINFTCLCSEYLVDEFIPIKVTFGEEQ